MEDIETTIGEDNSLPPAFQPGRKSHYLLNFFNFFIAHEKSFRENKKILPPAGDVCNLFPKELIF
jgi:hypothetical protein